MSETKPMPWQQHGGSFVWQGSDRGSLPGPCCGNPDPKLIGDCGSGCCDDYECANCKRRWRYEWPD